ncbi:Protein FAM200B [Eumeta japonica]|uniref:Protein FAM200B n=1 Tax=Eumeta variegata TaxID=151549 RepID=A0A4C1TRT6_EUMVA|nr:Protein FAM200B [Eumeta japonica]
MRRLITKHQKEADKPLDFFERKLKAASSVNESALLASYKVTYRVAKAGKPHTIAENLILPAALDKGEIMITTICISMQIATPTAPRGPQGPADRKPKSCALKEYVQLRTDRTDAPLGGTVINYKRSLQCCPIDLPNLINIEEVLASVDRRKLPADALELLRAKNAALHHAYAYPSREDKSKARAVQRRTKAHMTEVKNEEWSNLIEDITLSHQTFWKLNKSFKSGGYLPTPPLKKPDRSLAVDGLEKAKCLADSLEFQRSHTLPPRNNHHIIRIKEEQALRLVEYITEGFKTKKRTVAVPFFFDVAKVFDRIWHAGLTHKLYRLEVPDRLIHKKITNRQTCSYMIILTLLEDPYEREFLKAPRSLPFCDPRTLTIYRDRRQASNSRYLPMIPPYIYAAKLNIAFVLTSRGPSMS